MNLAVLGMILNLGSTFGTAIAYIILRKAFLNANGRMFLKLPIYWLYLLVLGTSQLLAVAALSMADVSVLSIGSCMTIIFNSLLAWKFLGEKLQLFKILSIFMMCVGVCLGVAFIPYSEHTYSSKELYQLFTSGRSVYFLGFSFFILIIGYIISETIVKRSQKDSQNRLQSSWRIVPKIIFPIIASLFCGLTCILTKGVSQIIITNPDNHNFSYWFSYVVIILMPLSILTQLLLMNRAFKYFK